MKRLPTYNANVKRSLSSPQRTKRYFSLALKSYEDLLEKKKRVSCGIFERVCVFNA